MSDKDQHIFKGLQNHELTPPPAFLDNILDKTGMPEKGQNKDAWKALQQHEVKPPASFFPQIRKNKEKNTPVIIYLRRAAAVAAIILAGFFIFRLIPRKTDKGTEVEGSISVELERKSTAPIKPGTDHKSQKTNLAAVIKKKAAVENSKEEMDAISTYLADGGIASFMDCKDCHFSVYYSEKKKKIIIDVDQYSSAIVSDKMMKFMKDLYSTNKRNKPKPKARRAKRVLDRWKKTDAVYFDSSYNKSALDIIDLTEYTIENNKEYP